MGGHSAHISNWYCPVCDKENAMTTDIEKQAEELLNERIYPETAAHHNMRVTQCLSALLDELKQAKAQIPPDNLIWITRQELAAFEEIQQQRDELREALEVYADKNSWQVDDWNIRCVFIAPYGDGWYPAQQALKKGGE
jgi:hypothetical protein